MKTANPAKPRLWRYTVAQFDRMVRQNVFGNARVELIEGRVIEMSPQLEPHAVSVILAGEVARRIFGVGHTVRQQMPIRIGTRSKPEPDIAVVAGEPRSSLQSGTPTSAVLIIEVSDTTLGYDRGKKASLYAKGGIAEYWIVNLVNRQLEVHRGPVAEPAHPWGFKYDSIQIFKPGAAVSPMAATHMSIAVDDLLP